MYIWETGSGVNGRYFYTLRDETLLHISEVANYEENGIYQVQQLRGDLLMASFRNWSVDLRKFRQLGSSPRATYLPLEQLASYSFKLSKKANKSLKKIQALDPIREQVTAISQKYGVTIYFGERKGFKQLLENKEELMLKLKLLPERVHLCLHLEKMLYQVGVLLHVLEAINPTTVSPLFLSRNYKGKHLDHPQRLYSQYKENYGSPPEKLSGLFGRKERLTLGRPSIIVNTPSETFSLWHEAQIPTPDPSVPRLRPDLIIKQGSHETLFDSKILDDIRDYEVNGEELAPSFYDCMKEIDMLIECKTFQWGWNKMEEQIKRYNHLLQPKHFLLITKSQVPPTDKKHLEEYNVNPIDCFSLPTTQEKLTHVFENIGWRTSE